MMRRLIFFLALTIAMPTIAESEISIYGGLNSLSVYNGTRVANDAEQKLDSNFDYSNDYDTDSYYGVRYTNWFADSWGVALDYNAATYSSPSVKKARGEDVSSQITRYTLSGVKRLRSDGFFRPYLGLGVGIGTPDFAALNFSSPSETHIADESGFVSTAFAGTSFFVTDNVGLFLEYKVDYSSFGIDAKPAIESVDYKAEIFSQSFNMGLSLSF